MSFGDTELVKTLIKALKEALAPVPFGSMPLLNVKALQTASRDWQTVLKFTGAPDRVYYVYEVWVSTDWVGAVGECEIRVMSDGEEVCKIDNSGVDEPYLYGLYMGKLCWTGVNSKGHWYVQIKSDGTNFLQCEALIAGITTKIPT